VLGDDDWIVMRELRTAGSRSFLTLRELSALYMNLYCPKPTLGVTILVGR